VNIRSDTLVYRSFINLGNENVAFIRERGSSVRRMTACVSPYLTVANRFLVDKKTLKQV
jgi:hypothetical protein